MLKINSKVVRILKYIVSVIGVFAIVSLAFALVKLTEGEVVKNFKGADFAFGTKFEIAGISFSIVKASAVVIVAYSGLLLASGFNLVNLKKHETLKQILVTLCFVFATYYMWRLKDCGFGSNSISGVVKITAIAYVTNILLTIGSVLSAIILTTIAKVEDLVYGACLIFGFMGLITFIVPIAGGQFVYNTTIYSRSIFSGVEIMFKNVKYNNVATKTIYTVITYVSLLLGFIGVIVPVKQKKYKYLVSSLLFLIGVIFFILIPIKSFPATKTSDYYAGVLTREGWWGIVFSAVSFASCLYLASKTQIDK